MVRKSGREVGNKRPGPGSGVFLPSVTTSIRHSTPFLQDRVSCYLRVPTTAGNLDEPTLARQGTYHTELAGPGF